MIPCSPEDLAANRQGQLSAAQRASFERSIKNGRKLWPMLSSMWLVFCALGAAGNIQKHGVASAVGGAAVMAAIVIVPLMWVGRRISARAWRGFEQETVERVTGRLQHYRRGRYGPYCYVAFNGQHMIAPLHLIKPYRKELAEHTFHVYYLRHGGNLLSLEPAQA